MNHLKILIHQLAGMTKKGCMTSSENFNLFLMNCMTDMNIIINNQQIARKRSMTPTIKTPKWYDLPGDVGPTARTPNCPYEIF